uniref:Uncharacterized protein n=1 Tax=Oryza brachyantha TaxID=4533 RepID=J3LY62_ORYBR
MAPTCQRASVSVTPRALTASRHDGRTDVAEGVEYRTEPGEEDDASSVARVAPPRPLTGHVETAAACQETPGTNQPTNQPTGAIGKASVSLSPPPIPPLGAACLLRLVQLPSCDRDRRSLSKPSDQGGGRLTSSSSSSYQWQPKAKATTTPTRPPPPPVPPASSFRQPAAPGSDRAWAIPTAIPSLFGGAAGYWEESSCCCCCCYGALSAAAATGQSRSVEMELSWERRSQRQS